MNIIQQFTCSIYKYSEYPRLKEIKLWRVLLYLLIGVVISVALTLALSIYPVYSSMGGITGAINRLPEFEISNGRLQTEKIDYYDAEARVKVLVDTGTTITRSSVEKANVAIGIYIDSEKAYVKNNANVIEYKFDDVQNVMGDVAINKEFLLTKVPLFKLVMLISIVYILIFMYIGAFIQAWFFAMIGNIINIIFVRAKIRILELIKISIFAMTMPSILKLVLLLFMLPMSSIVFGGIVIAYIYLALKYIKAEEVVEI